MLNNQMNMGNQSHVASQCVMIETSRYQDMYLRPYETHYDIQTEKLLDEYTDGGTNISAAAVSRVSNLFLKPAAMPESNVVIANGFDEKRYSFMIQIETQGRLAGSLITVLTGYTDYAGSVNLRGGRALDPNMRLYFNSLYVYRNEETATRHGIQQVSSMSRGSQIAHNSSNGSNNPYSGYNNPVYMARPEDVSSMLSFQNDPVMSEFRNHGAGDNRNLLTSAPRASKRGNASRSSYLSDILTNFRSANLAADAVDNSDIWAEARTLGRETSLNESALFLTLSMQTDYTSTGSITYGDLCDVVQNLDNCTDVLDSRSAYTIDSTSNWANATFEAQAATIIQQATSAIMSDCLLMGVHFIAHNDTLDGNIDIIVPGFQSYNSKMDMTKNIQRFIDRLFVEVMSDVSVQNQQRFSVDCKIELMYEAAISISIDGGPEELFIAPAFCDALYAATLTNNQSMVENIASDIDMMVGSLEGLHHSQEYISSGNSRIVTPSNKIIIPSSI
jgi:hypothetical protein